MLQTLLEKLDFAERLRLAINYYHSPLKLPEIVIEILANDKDKVIRSKIRERYPDVIDKIMNKSRDLKVVTPPIERKTTTSNYKNNLYGYDYDKCPRCGGKGYLPQYWYVDISCSQCMCTG